MRIYQVLCGFFEGFADYSADCVDFLDAVRILLLSLRITWYLCGLFNSCVDFLMFVRMKIARFNNYEIEKR